MTLSAYFAQHPKAALGFSGGVDSSYLLYAARQAGCSIRPYFVRTPFQPQFELDVLADPAVAANPAERCYHCKRRLFGTLAARALADGYTLLLDGTNASDDADDRPGMRALRELHVASPLRECGLSKPEIRRLSKQAGLFTWDKPAYACLATRIPTGTPITAEALRITERGEGYLFSLGLRDFRIRFLHGAARLQVPEAQLPLVLAHREEIVRELKRNYSAVMLDLEVRP